jgi:hypothetical protein
MIGALLGRALGGSVAKGAVTKTVTRQAVKHEVKKEAVKAATPAPKPLAQRMVQRVGQANQQARAQQQAQRVQDPNPSTPTVTEQRSEVYNPGRGFGRGGTIAPNVGGGSSFLRGGYKSFTGSEALTGVAQTSDYLPYQFGSGYKAHRTFTPGRGFRPLQGRLQGKGGDERGGVWGKSTTTTTTTSSDSASRIRPGEWVQPPITGMQGETYPLREGPQVGEKYAQHVKSTRSKRSSGGPGPGQQSLF